MMVGGVEGKPALRHPAAGREQTRKDFMNVRKQPIDSKWVHFPSTVGTPQPPAKSPAFSRLSSAF